MMKSIVYFSLVLFFITMIACTQRAPSVPKPRAFPRVERDSASELHSFDQFQFSYSTDAKLQLQRADKPNQFWYNMEYDQFNATLYCSYISLIAGELEKVMHDNKVLLQKQKEKYADIFELTYDNPQESVYGVLYELRGNTLAPLQFYLTDSTTYFLRGSLYYNTQVNIDSVAPITQSLQGDIKNLMETFHHKSRN